MILCCPNAFLDSLRCIGVTCSLPQHPLAGGHPAALPAHIPSGVFLWEQPGQHSRAGSAGSAGESRDTPSCPSPTASHGWACSTVLQGRGSCHHELIYVFLKIFLVWDLFKACFPLIPGTTVLAQLMFLPGWSPAVLGSSFHTFLLI